MKKILLVEDDEFLRTLYIDLLKNLKATEVTSVIDGREAFNKIKNDFFDLILLDTLLPNMNAIDILNNLKTAHPDKLNQKIVIITNLDDEKMLEQIKAFHYNIIIKSQLNPEEFINKIKLILNYE